MEVRIQRGDWKWEDNQSDLVVPGERIAEFERSNHDVKINALKGGFHLLLRIYARERTPLPRPLVKRLVIQVAEEAIADGFHLPDTDNEAMVRAIELLTPAVKSHFTALCIKEIREGETKRVSVRKEFFERYRAWRNDSTERR